MLSNRALLRGISVGLLLSACSLAMGVGDSKPLPPYAQSVLDAFPGARVQVDQDRARTFYGRPMTTGRTPDEAAAKWVDSWAGALAGSTVTLREVWSSDAYAGKFRVYGYVQEVDGVPVEFGNARVLVQRGVGARGMDAVVLASGTLARIPDDGIPPAMMTGADAVQTVRAMPLYKGLPVWSQASQVIFQGETDKIDPVRCWKFIGENTSLAGREKYTFFVEDLTGRLIHVRNEVLNDVNGKVMGKGTPGTRPDIGPNPPTDLAMPEIKVNLAGGGTSFSGLDGSYTIGFGGSGSVTVSAAVGVAGSGAGGRWVDVANQAGSIITASQTGDAASPVNLLFNGSPSELTTAQVNAFICQTLTHNYFKDRAPGFTGLDSALPANVNIGDVCNAYYDGGSTNFYRSGGGCVNTAYSSVVSHEYGHHIVNQLGLAQGSFGEGYGDTTGMLLWDDYIVGREFFGAGGGYIRNPRDDRVQYPCGSEIHTCGETIAGCWWWIRENLTAKYGSSDALDLTRETEIAWSLVTVGGSGNDSAFPGTAIEVLTIDDDDGTLANGTPNYPEICAAFSRHNISCPEIQLIGFEYPDGRPDFVTPDQTSTVRVNVVGIAGTPKPGTGWVYYNVDGASFTGFRMAEPKPNEYVATLPAAPCGSVINYYFTAESVEAGVRSDPPAAPESAYKTLSATGILQVVADDFQTDMGWTAGAPGDTATTGVWTRNVPQDTGAQPGADHTAGAGTRCWVTDYRAGSSIGDFDVDGGYTTLLSPVFDLSAAPSATVAYWRWYSNDQGSTPGTDTFLVDISSDGGSTWKRAETVGPDGDGTHGQWFFHDFVVSDFVTPTSQVRLRFIAQDLGSGSLVEAAVDDFAITASQCGAVCRPDCNKDKKLDIGDFICFQSEWNGRTAYGDFNGDGKYTVNDFVAFQGTFVRGCK